MTGTWREHPNIRDRFSPDYPDHTVVVIHDGGPRFSPLDPEIALVKVTGFHGDVFAGTLSSKPQRLGSVAQGDQIKFLAPAGKYLVMATEKYLQERPDWIIMPCNQCGLDELLDAPSDLIRVIFPDLPEGDVLTAFSSVCGICRGIQVVRARQPVP